LNPRSQRPSSFVVFRHRNSLTHRDAIAVPIPQNRWQPSIALPVAWIQSGVNDGYFIPWPIENRFPGRLRRSLLKTETARVVETENSNENSPCPSDDGNFPHTFSIPSCKQPALITVQLRPWPPCSPVTEPGPLRRFHLIRQVTPGKCFSSSVTTRHSFASPIAATTMLRALLGPPASVHWDMRRAQMSAASSSKANTRPRKSAWDL
jgi:hypothetical protein